MDTEKAAKNSWSPVLLEDENKILGKNISGQQEGHRLNFLLSDNFGQMQLTVGLWIRLVTVQL